MATRSQARARRGDGRAPVLIAVVILLAAVAAVSLYNLSRDSVDPRIGSLVQQVQAVVVLIAAILAALQYVWAGHREAAFRGEQRAHEFIARFNAPEFSIQKSKAAQAYQRRVRGKKPAEITDFLKLELRSDIKDASEGLFAIFTVLNFFEEVATAYFNDEVDDQLLRNYLAPTAIGIHRDYRAFLSAMPSYYPLSRKLVDEWSAVDL